MKIIKAYHKGITHDVIVDDDFEYSKKIFIDKGYAKINHQGKLQRLHRHIVGAKNGEVVDHINGNKLDNRKENLRITTQEQNTRNRKAKGYFWSKQMGKWSAQIKVDNKKIHLGYFDNKEEAISKYREAHKNAFGEFSPW
ncbi:HNH endonuclease [Bacillus phage 056SW001B]|uniref:HNH endonuclease n=1 Tax=Bacillus phage 056SW001B TaxID=2601663 RepID=A0A5P8PIN4_9CAUD|nr:HNH endonuclease [Bacillus phage 056SW001B]